MTDLATHMLPPGAVGTTRHNLTVHCVPDWAATRGHVRGFALISIKDGKALPPQFSNHFRHVCRLSFDDVLGPDDVALKVDQVPPDGIDLCFALAWAKGVIDRQVALRIPPVIYIHCGAGVSRSTALALGVYAQHYGRGNEDLATYALAASNPQALPNPWVVDMLDTLLDADGELVRSARRRWPGRIASH